MKLVFKLLAAACLLLGLAGTVIDLVEGNFGEDTVTVLIVAVLAAGVFGYLAWLWRGKSPVKRVRSRPDRSPRTFGADGRRSGRCPPC